MVPRARRLYLFLTKGSLLRGIVPTGSARLGLSRSGLGVIEPGQGLSGGRGRAIPDDSTAGLLTARPPPSPRASCDQGPAGRAGSGPRGTPRARRERTPPR